MAVLTTKYSIGDIVWRSDVTTERKQHPCPDCLDTRKWKATSPAGNEYEFRCPRCATRYRSDHDMSLEYTASVPYVQRLTIGSVQFNTAVNSHDYGAWYMCYETGIGSGSVYRETDLHETEEIALMAAKAKAAHQDKTSERIVKVYNDSLEISDYELESAKLKFAKDAAIHARSLLWNLDDLFGRIAEASGKDDILEMIEEYKTYDYQRDKQNAVEPSPEIAA